jgi:hypothetical protein
VSDDLRLFPDSDTATQVAPADTGGGVSHPDSFSIPADPVGAAETIRQLFTVDELDAFTMALTGWHMPRGWTQVTYPEPTS